jgi:hypothetical protein
VPEDSARSFRPEAAQPDPAVDVLPEIDDGDALLRGCHADRPQFLDAPRGRRDRQDQPGAVLVQRTRRPGHRNPAIRRRTGLPRRTGRGEPGWIQTAEVGGLPVHEVGMGDVAFTAEPAFAGGEEGLRPGGVVDRGQEGGFGAETVGPALEAVPAPEPSVGQQGGNNVFATDQQVRDVPLLHLEALPVGREAGSQFVIAHAGAVDEKLVDAVGGGVHNRPLAGSGARHPVEGTPEPVGGPLAGFRAPRLDGGDPLGITERVLDGNVRSIGSHGFSLESVLKE